MGLMLEEPEQCDTEATTRDADLEPAPARPFDEINANLARLFNKAPRPSRAIHLELEKLVRFVARGYNFPNKETKEEHISAVLTVVIDQVKQVDPDQNPARWFRNLINWRFINLLEQDRNRPLAFSSLTNARTNGAVDGSSPIPAIPDRLAVARRARRPPPAISAEEIGVLRWFFDRRIRQTVDGIRELESHSSPEDPERHERLITHSYGILDGLQESCRYSLLEYRPCSLRRVRFTKDRRLPGED